MIVGLKHGYMEKEFLSVPMILGRQVEPAPFIHRYHNSTNDMIPTQLFRGGSGGPDRYPKKAPSWGLDYMQIL